VENRWLTDDERVAWVRLAAVLELLPGVSDTQLRRDADLSHFEYFVLAMLSEAPERTLRMTSLAARTNAFLPGSRTWCAGSRTAVWSGGSRARRTAGPPTRS
jgi:hypothetical protein